MKDIVIVAAARTSVGSFLRTLGTVSEHAFGNVATKAAIPRAGLEPADVDELILNEVRNAGEDHTPLRQAVRAANISDEKTTFSINRLCGLRLRAIEQTAQRVRIDGGMGVAMALERRIPGPTG